MKDPGLAGDAAALAGPFARVLEELVSPRFRLLSFGSIPLAAWLQSVLFGGGLVRALVVGAVLVVLQVAGDRRGRRLAVDVRRAEALNRAAQRGAGDPGSNL